MDICGYVDYQYNILNRSLLEAEIEYQHECFETLKNKYNRYITEADEELNDDFKVPSISSILLYQLKKSVSQFFKKITEAMQRWIVKIISHSKKFGKKVEDYFDAYKSTLKSPDISVNYIASSCVNAIDEWWEDASTTKDKLKVIYDYLTNQYLEKEETSYHDELAELLAYKRSISTIKSCEKTYEIKSKVYGGNDLVKDTKAWLCFVKEMIKLIQIRATYAAKLILKAAKMAFTTNGEIPKSDIKKMDQDIENIKLNIVTLKQTMYDYKNYGLEEDD